jgi:RNA polymerase sigma factor (sigma-70 family)
MTQHIKEIWKSVVEGDHDAWKSLVRRYQALVITVARRVGLSPPDAEDCAQQTWMSLYRNRRAIKDPERLPAWLIRTTRRRAVRTAQRLVRTSPAEPDSRFETNVSQPDEEVLLVERQGVLEVALEQLDPRCAKLLRALFFSPEDKSYREIARDLEISPNTLGPLRSRCLKRLREILEEMGYPLN